MTGEQTFYEAIKHNELNKMPFVTVPGLKGKVYIPDDKPEYSKKHPCRNCYSCQSCSDDRCEVCRGPGACRNP